MNKTINIVEDWTGEKLVELLDGQFVRFAGAYENATNGNTQVWLHSDEKFTEEEGMKVLLEFIATKRKEDEETDEEEYLDLEANAFQTPFYH